MQEFVDFTLLASVVDRLMAFKRQPLEAWSDGQAAGQLAG